MNISSVFSFLKKITYFNITMLRSARDKQIVRRKRSATKPLKFPFPEEILKNRYFFILSTGRCGTGLVTKILDCSQELYVEHNPKPELEYVSSLIHKNGASLDALKLAILAARFDVYFLEAYLRGKIFVETNNRISFFAPALASLLPNSKFIHLVRNPSDFVRSGMRRGYYADGVVQHQRLDGSNFAQWNNFSRLEKIAWEWNEINKKIEEFKTITSEDRILTIKSEDLYKVPEATFDIFRFLEVKNPFLTAKGTNRLIKLLSKPVNKQKTGNFPKYQNWKNADKLALWRIATLAPYYGYMSDI